MVIAAVNAAFEDRELALNCVRVCVSPDILSDRVVDRRMAREGLAHFRIDRALICAKVCILGDSVYKDRLEALRSHVRDMPRLYLTATLNQRHDTAEEATAAIQVFFTRRII